MHIPASHPDLAPLLSCPRRSAAAADAWTKLTGFEAGRKENVQRASMWAGQRIKQAPAHSAPAAAPLEVFVDPELQVCSLGGAAAVVVGRMQPVLQC